MARKKPGTSAEFVLFNVLYEDGTRSSNRKVPLADVEGFDAEDAIRAAIEAQDRRVAELSGKRPPIIQSITRADGRR